MKFHNKYWRYFLLFALVISPAIRFIFVPIFNEDFLVLSWHNPQSLLDCFTDFYKSMTGGPYWRPVVWTSYFVTKYFVGYDGTVYHLTNLIVYGLINILILKLLLKMGFESKFSFALVLAFALLPSRELLMAWVPGRTDLFMTFFLLIAVNFYISAQRKTHFFLAGMFFLLSILSKETAYAGALLPILFYIIDRSKFKEKAIASAVAMLIIAASLAFRYVFIGGTPFGSSNFAEISLFNIAKNYIIYLFLVFVNADILEVAAHTFNKYPWLSIVPLLIIFVVAYAKRKTHIDKNKIYFALLWFALFILPATPLLMQWYGFVASIGLITLFAELLKFESKAKYIILYSIFIICAVNTFNRSNLWIDAGEKTIFALNSLKKLDPQSDTIYLFGMPDKINRINSMKIGSQQAVQYILANDKIEVEFPLRSEIVEESNIDAKQVGNELELSLNQGRFLIAGMKSTNIFKDETAEAESDYFKIKIYNFKSGQSKAIIALDSSISHDSYYFDGKSFLKIK